MTVLFCDAAPVKKLICCGLPRSGTTSTAKALELLGFKVMHHCIYTNPEGGLNKKVIERTRAFLKEPGNRAVVSHTLHPYMEFFPDIAMVYLSRPMHEVAESLVAIGQNPNDLKYYGQKPSSKAAIISTEDLGWTSLCAAINEPVPDVPFPRVNKR